MRPRLLPLLAPLLLALPGACALPEAAVPLPGVTCPPAGTVVRFRDRTERWLGADPADAAICRVERDGIAERRLAGLHDAALPGAAAARRDFAGLFPLRPGRATQPRGGATAWRVLGEEAVPIGTGLRSAWVLEERPPGADSGRSTVFLYLLDQETGAPLGQRWLRPPGRLGGADEGLAIGFEAPGRPNPPAGR